MSPPDRVLVCVAWPYANGPLHLGHVAGSLLPPDVFARFQRMRGAKVAMVSGSDMHGTPITVAAEKAGMAPEAFAAMHHEGHKASLKALGIRFDLFTSTATANHREVVQDVFLTLQRQGLIVKKPMTAPFDPQVRRFLPDRYVEGTCPHCGKPGARGDQCDACGRTLDPQELKDPRSKLSGAAPEYRETEHFFLRLPAFEERLKAWVSEQAHWRPSVVNFTQNWLREGLKDRAITRDMTYGVPIPLAGYDDKRIYVWFEAVIGYLSATKEWATLQGRPDAWKDYWLDPATRSYYFLGKDNIPFHTIIWPAMILGYSDGNGKRHNLPYDVPANEFMNFQGSKFSKSRGNLITVDEILSSFEPDAVRYYLGANLPEKGDTNWAWDDFVAKVNDELVGTWGNLAHRVVSFTRKHFAEVPPVGTPLDERDRALLARIGQAHAAVTDLVTRVELKKALKEVVALAAEGNRYVDEKAPWKLAKTDPEALKTTLHVSLRLVRSLAVLTAPFLPFSADRLWKALGNPGSVHDVPWSAALDDVPAGAPLAEPQVLFAKIDPKSIHPEEKPVPENAPAATPAPAPAPAGAATASPFKPTVTIEDFAKLDLRVGQVLSCEPHPKADKLWVLQVDLGVEKRQILAGLREHVKPEELVGRRIVVIANLAPRNIRGLDSQGMVLAAEADGVVAPLTPARDVRPGAGVK